MLGDRFSIFFYQQQFYICLLSKKLKNYVILIIGVLIIADMWSVDKRYLNDSHFVKKKEMHL